MSPDATHRYEIGGQTLDELRQKYPFDPDDYGCPKEPAGAFAPTRIHDLAFPNLVTAARFIEEIGPEPHTDVWFSPARPPQIWGPVVVSVRLRAVRRPSSPTVKATANA